MSTNNTLSTNKSVEPPNVLLITIDTLRLDRLGCYGGRQGLTPNLDRFAAESVCFEQAVTGGSWTQAAFPVLLTSTFASMYGGCIGVLSPQRPSPVGVLQEAGYETSAFSTSPLLSHDYAYNRGFDRFVDLQPQERDPFLRRVKGGQWLLRRALTHRAAGLFRWRTRPAKVYASGDSLTQTVVDSLENATQPFFYWAHYMDVHWPYHIEAELKAPGAIAQAWRDLAELDRLKLGGLTEAQRAYYVQLYDRAVAFADAQVGNLLDYLRASQLLENTIVVIASDHGEEFQEHGRWGHLETNLFDEILRVPLLVRLPGQQKRVSVDQPVSLIDIMPTLLALCGCEQPEQMEGASLAPLWDEPGVRAAQPTISEMHRAERHIVAVRTRAFKYIWESRRPQQPALYDLTRDPGERHNVIAENPEQAQKLAAVVADHLQYVHSANTGGAAREPELSAEVVARLRSLGYVD